MAKADEIRHFHVCGACDHIWTHTRAEVVSSGKSDSHRCPACKQGCDFIASSTMRDAIERRDEFRRRMG